MWLATLTSWHFIYLFIFVDLIEVCFMAEINTKIVPFVWICMVALWFTEKIPNVCTLCIEMQYLTQWKPFHFSFFLFAFQSVLFSLKCTSNWAMKRVSIVMGSLCLNLKMGFSQPCASHEEKKSTLTEGKQNNVSTSWRRTLVLKWLDHSNSNDCRGGLEQVKCQWAPGNSGLWPEISKHSSLQSSKELV